jgi:hypothetical protein
MRLRCLCDHSIVLKDNFGCVEIRFHASYSSEDISFTDNEITSNDTELQYVITHTYMYRMHIL